jgi:hypothetical protein
MRCKVFAIIGLLTCAIAGSAYAIEMEWRLCKTDRFSLAVEYPATLFPRTSFTAGDEDAEWLFGPHVDGASLMIRVRAQDGQETPYHAACGVACPGETYRLNKRTIAATSGYVNGRIFYSKCVLANGNHGAEMHCFHLIYPMSKRPLYDAVVNRMSATLR